jgi:hypothetical protein
MNRKAKSETEYQFTVSLRRAACIRRSVVLRGDQTLHDLHEVIFSAFDRFDPHLYCFYLGADRKRRSSGRVRRSIQDRRPSTDLTTLPPMGSSARHAPGLIRWA